MGGRNIFQIVEQSKTPEEPVLKLRLLVLEDDREMY